MRYVSSEIGSPGTSVHDEEDKEGMNCWNKDCNMDGEVLIEKLAIAAYVHQINQFKYICD